MAKVTKKLKVGSIEKPFLIVNGQKKFEIELTLTDVSYISNALKFLGESKLSFMSNARKRDVKKLHVFFENLLEE